MISRSLNLRRLSFVLLAAEQDHYLTRLPSIQEKLVEILRTNVVSPGVHSEVSSQSSSCADIQFHRSTYVCAFSCVASVRSILPISGQSSLPN